MQGSVTAILAAFVASLVLATPAPALDPESPAGQQYVLPIDKARQEAAGNKGRFDASPAESAGAPRFGEGVRSAPEGTGKATQDASGPGEAGSTDVAATAATVEADSGVFPVALGLMGVVAISILVYLGLRRRRAP